MGLFRRSISQDELRAALPEAQKGRQVTVYQASRGGWFPKPKKPVPGTPKAS